MPPPTVTKRRRRDRFSKPEPISAAVRRALAGERSPRAQFTLIVDGLRPELVRVARVAGVGASAEDVVSDVITRHLVRALADPPATFATPDAYQHLRAGLLVSVRNAARNWHRDNRRTIFVEGDVLIDLLESPDVHSPVEELLFEDEDARALRDAISRLGAAESQVAQLIGVEEFSARAAAAMMGVPKSTVHDAWSRVQRSIRMSVDRYLEGGYCAECAPHLALLDAQRRAERDGCDDRPLDEAVGAERAVEIARHVYGSPADGEDDGCRVCRLTRTRERAALRSFLPPPFIAPVPGLLGSVHDSLVDLWDATVGALGRLVDDATSVVIGASGTAAGIGGGKAAALVTSATLAIGASTIAPHVVMERPARPPASMQITKPTAAAPALVAAPRRTFTPRATVTPSTARPSESVATRRRAPARGATGRAFGTGGSALSEFTPGP